MAEAASYRLPRTVVPEHYQLTITPELAEGSFAGESRIRVRVEEPVDRIVLNAIELDIHSAELEDEKGSRLQGRVELDEGEERATIWQPALDSDPANLILYLKSPMNHNRRSQQPDRHQAKRSRLRDGACTRCRDRYIVQQRAYIRVPAIAIIKEL